MGTDRIDNPPVSVVVTTRNRARHLESLLAGLRRQTLAPEHFEVVVVDDGSRDGSAALLDREASSGELDLRVIHRARPGGWALAREEGWRVARGEVIAFIDDDCIPSDRWLEAGLEACGDETIVQGRTDPARDERRQLGTLELPFTHTISVDGPDPHHQTCNVFYPRALLERVGGFDVNRFSHIQGEDADLAWRCLESGARSRFCAPAKVEHAYIRLGPLGKLRRAASWDLRVYALHPGLRRAWFVRRWFWKGSHYLLVRSLLAAFLPRRWHLVRAWLALPYAVHLAERGRVEGGGLKFAPYFALNDLIELAAALRSTLRYRVPML